MSSVTIKPGAYARGKRAAAEEKNGKGVSRERKMSEALASALKEQHRSQLYDDADESASGSESGSSSDRDEGGNGTQGEDVMSRRGTIGHVASSPLSMPQRAALAPPPPDSPTREQLADAAERRLAFSSSAPSPDTNGRPLPALPPPSRASSVARGPPPPLPPKDPARTPSPYVVDPRDGAPTPAPARPPAARLTSGQAHLGSFTLSGGGRRGLLVRAQTSYFVPPAAGAVDDPTSNLDSASTPIDSSRLTSSFMVLYFSFAFVHFLLILSRLRTFLTLFMSGLLILLTRLILPL
jgi:hypothetical protein